MSEFRDLLKQAKLPERTVPICLRGDLVAVHEGLERELELAQQDQASSLAGSGAGVLADRIRDLEQEMRVATYRFVLRAMPRAAWRELVNAHPPRENDQGEVIDADRLAGVNQDTFPEAMVRASVIDPAPDEIDWDDLLGKLTDRQFDQLVLAGWDLNQGKVDIPFSRAASRALKDSDGA